MDLLLEWIVVVVPVIVVVSAEEFTRNELDPDEVTETELALGVESIKIDTDEVDSLVVEDEVVDKAGSVDANDEADRVVIVNLVEAVTVDEAVTVVGALTIVGTVTVVGTRPANSGGSWELGSKKEFGLLESFEQNSSTLVRIY